MVEMEHCLLHRETAAGERMAGRWPSAAGGLLAWNQVLLRPRHPGQAQVWVGNVIIG